MSNTNGSGWQGMPFAVHGGFTSYRVGAESMKVYFHAHSGTVLYVTPPILKRTKTPQPDPGPPGLLCGKAPGPGCMPHKLPPQQ